MFNETHNENGRTPAHGPRHHTVVPAALVPSDVSELVTKVINAAKLTTSSEEFPLSQFPIRIPILIKCDPI